MNRGRVHPNYVLLSVAHQSRVINDYYQLLSENKEKDTLKGSTQIDSSD